MHILTQIFGSFGETVKERNDEIGVDVRHREIPKCNLQFNYVLMNVTDLKESAGNC